MISINEKTDTFLQLYKQMEYDGRRVYFPDSKENESIIGRLINIPQLRQYKEDLDYCRVVRNFLTHNPKVGGTYPISPSDEMISLMKKCVNIINNPPHALDYAVKYNSMMTASLYDKVVDVIKIMNENIYTHIPVMEKNKLIGVFSDNTIYSCLCRENSITINSETLIKDFEQYLPLDKHISEYFEFVPEKAMLYEIEELFHYNIRNHKLLTVVYITKNGRQDEPILGMITPWDLLAENYSK